MISCQVLTLPSSLPSCPCHFVSWGLADVSAMLRERLLPYLTPYGSSVGPMSPSLVALGKLRMYIKAHNSLAMLPLSTVGSPMSRGLSNHKRYMSSAQMAWPKTLSASELTGRPCANLTMYCTQNHSACKQTRVLTRLLALVLSASHIVAVSGKGKFLFGPLVKS